MDKQIKSFDICFFEILIKNTFLFLIDDLELPVLVLVPHIAQLVRDGRALLGQLGVLVVVRFEHHLVTSQFLLYAVELHANGFAFTFA